MFCLHKHKQPKLASSRNNAIRLKVRKVGKVGKAGKVGKVGKAGKAGSVRKLLPPLLRTYLKAGAKVYLKG